MSLLPRTASVPVLALALLGSALVAPALAAPEPTRQAASTASAAASLTSPGSRVRTIELGGVRTRVRPATRQVVTVRHTDGYGAVVSLWRRDRDGRGWDRRMRTTDGRIGYGGLVPAAQRVQGTGTTPSGTFTTTEAFGNAPRPRGTALPYHRTHPGDFWVQDNASRHYNTRRHRSAGGFRWWLPTSDANSSERLRDYGSQYRWAVVIDFNRPPDAVRHRGSGIFLHVNGDGATAGCVSVPRPFMRATTARLRPGLHPRISIGN